MDDANVGHSPVQTDLFEDDVNVSGNEMLNLFAFLRLHRLVPVHVIAKVLNCSSLQFCLPIAHAHDND